MTPKDYDLKRTSPKSIDDLYRVATTLEEKVDEILDELKELIEAQRDHTYRHYPMADDDYALGP